MISLKTDISKVTAFRNGARVIRTGKVAFKAGTTKVIIEGITDYAEKDSIRVTSLGPALITSFDVKTRSILRRPKEELETRFKELEKLRLRAREIRDLLEIEQERQQRIVSMGKSFADMFGISFAAGEGEISQMDEIDKTSEKLLIEISDKISDLKKEREKTEDRIRVIEENISDIESTVSVREVHDVEVILNVKEDSEVTLEVTYQVNGAKWEPSYDIDILDEGTKLRRIAMIYNDTRESWENVSLVVSTSSTKPVEAIEPIPFFIREFIPRPKRVKAKKAMRAAGIALRPSPTISIRHTPEIEPEAEPMDEMFAEVEESFGGVAVYEIPKLITIPDDGEKHPVTLIEEDLESKTFHYWYTEEMPDVVAYNEIENGSVVILPGPMRVFANGEFIGETYTEIVSPLETFRAGVRTAYDVKAKKELVEKIVEKAGFTRGKMRRKYKYRIVIENFAKDEISIEVNDRIPHSESEKVTVKFDWQKFFKEEPKLGILKWELKIPPSEKKTIEYEFEVEWERGVSFSVPLP